MYFTRVCISGDREIVLEMPNHDAPFSSNAAYRQYMTRNAADIIYDNWRFACNNLKPGVFQTRARAGQSNPHVYKSAFDNDNPSIYETNSVKEKHLEEYRRLARTISVDMASEDGLATM